ncbi:hypothetical protein EJB05_35184, partial [Eragrostis curvula]
MARSASRRGWPWADQCVAAVGFVVATAVRVCVDDGSELRGGDSGKARIQRGGAAGRGAGMRGRASSAWRHPDPVAAWRGDGDDEATAGGGAATMTMPPPWCNVSSDCIKAGNESLTHTAKRIHRPPTPCKASSPASSRGAAADAIARESFSCVGLYPEIPIPPPPDIEKVQGAAAARRWVAVRRGGDGAAVAAGGRQAVGGVGGGGIVARRVSVAAARGRRWLDGRRRPVRAAQRGSEAPPAAGGGCGRGRGGCGPPLSAAPHPPRPRPQPPPPAAGRRRSSGDGVWSAAGGGGGGGGGVGREQDEEQGWATHEFVPPRA